MLKLPVPRRSPEAEHVRDYLDYILLDEPQVPPSVIDLRDKPAPSLGEWAERLSVEQRG